MKRIFLIHGWEGRAEGGWRPWLKKELENRGFEVVVPQMPNADKPQFSEWLTHLQKIASFPDEQTYFVGHSLGCITILRYLENLSENEKIGGAVLVAGFPEPIGYEEIKSFVEPPLNYEKIKKHTNNFIAIHSDNDPYVPIKMGGILKEKLGAKLLIERGTGHFSGSEGHIELPIALEAVLEIADFNLKNNMSKIKEYQELCRRSAKKFDNPKEEILTWGLGIAGEAGDVASCIKKTFAHDNDQRAGIRENIGDSLWYIAMICNFFGWDLGEVLDENVNKLRKRYPDGFTQEDAARDGTMIDWNKK